MRLAASLLALARVLPAAADEEVALGGGEPRRGGGLALRAAPRASPGRP
jgi:hypothetical protein